VGVMAENAGVSNGEIQSQEDTPPTTESQSSEHSSPDFEARPGHLVGAQRGQHYVGGSSWETILHDASIPNALSPACEC
jgi:hypothetical protein